MATGKVCDKLADRDPHCSTKFPREKILDGYGYVLHEMFKHNMSSWYTYKLVSVEPRPDLGNNRFMMKYEYVGDTVWKKDTWAPVDLDLNTDRTSSITAPTPEPDPLSPRQLRMATGKEGDEPADPLRSSKFPPDKILDGYGYVLHEKRDDNMSAWHTYKLESVEPKPELGNNKFVMNYQYVGLTDWKKIPWAQVDAQTVDLIPVTQIQEPPLKRQRTAVPNP